MEIAKEEEDHDMPIPINTTYPNTHGHMIHHVGYNIKKDKLVMIKYKECMKNHAASIGGNANDGCGEFMPNGEEGSIEALTCSACNCHRNFHRRELEGGEERTFFPPYNNHHQPPSLKRKLMFHHHNHKMINSELEEEERGGSLTFRQLPRHNQRRFRTKFSKEQKEKMLSFAERIGWKIKREDESAVQEFCQEIGVRRRVFKVWMHNNKHNQSKIEISGNNEINKAVGVNLASI